MIYKYKFAAISSLLDQDKNPQYVVKVNDFSSGYTIFDDLSVTKLVEVVRSQNEYKIFLFGSLYTTINEDLETGTPELSIEKTDNDCYKLKMSETSTATITMQKGSMFIETQDTSKLVLSLSVALVLADKKSAKKETAEIIDSQPKPPRKSFKEIIPNIINNLKKLIIDKKPKTRREIMCLSAVLLGVLLVITSIILSITGVIAPKNVRKTTARVSSNGERITFDVGIVNYSLKLDHTESKNADITIYYTLKDDRQVDMIYFKPPVSFVRIIPICVGAILIIVPSSLLIFNRRKEGKRTLANL